MKERIRYAVAFLAGTALACCAFIAWYFVTRPPAPPSDWVVSAELRRYHQNLTNHVNSAQDLWLARLNPTVTWIPRSQLKKDDNVSDLWELFVIDETELPQRFVSNLPSTPYAQGSVLLPETFDAREKWIKCAHLHHPVINQGSCGSCWIVSVVSMLSDRICISSGEAKVVHLSAQNVISCLDMGCKGGDPDRVLEYWKDHGIVTGGAYGSVDGCQPYQHHSNCGTPCSKLVYMTTEAPKCSRKCRPGYRTSYKDDKHFGIYKYVAGKMLYGHCVKVIGWGTEKSTDYWLVSNSWGSDWGERGFAKIAIGDNIISIESQVVTGTPTA